MQTVTWALAEWPIAWEKPSFMVDYARSAYKNSPGHYGMCRP